MESKEKRSKVLEYFKPFTDEVKKIPENFNKLFKK